MGTLESVFSIVALNSPPGSWVGHIVAAAFVRNHLLDEREVGTLAAPAPVARPKQQWSAEMVGVSGEMR